MKQVEKRLSAAEKAVVDAKNGLKKLRRSVNIGGGIEKIAKSYKPAR